MKKTCLIYILFAFFVVTASPLFAISPVEACKSLQKQSLENLNNIKNCSSNASYGISPAYLFEGVKNGECHYAKIKFETGLKVNVLAKCSAPISVIQNFANDNIKATNEMCDAIGISLTGYTAKVDEANLEKYCK